MSSQRPSRLALPTATATRPASSHTRSAAASRPLSSSQAPTGSPSRSQLPDTPRSVPPSGAKASHDTLPTAKSLYSVEPFSERHEQSMSDRTHAARHSARPASAAATPGRHSAARAARRSGFNSEVHPHLKAGPKPFPSTTTKHTSRPAPAGHAKSQSLSTPRLHGREDWGAHSGHPEASGATKDPATLMGAKSYVSRETTAESSSSARVLPDGSVVRTHARTLSGSLRSYAASWIPPQLQAAASSAGRMTPTAGLRIPKLPSLSRRTSPARSAASSPAEATDKDSEDETPALRRVRSAMGDMSYAHAPQSTAVHNRSVYHRAHRSYSHTHSQSHQFTESSQRTHLGVHESHVHGSPSLRANVMPHRPASAQLIRTRASAMSPVQGDLVPVPALDLRRLDRAVNLAVDAAQAADENEARRQNRMRTRSRQGQVAPTGTLGSTWNDGIPASSSMPGYLPADGLGFSLPDMPDGGLPFGSSDAPPVFDDDLPTGLGSSLESETSIGTGPAANVRARIGRFLSLPRSSAAGAAMLLRNYAYGPTAPSEEELAAREEEAERRQDAELSLDLYISSLGYLLSALPPKEAMGVSEKHRAEMKATLLEALRKLESSSPGGSSMAGSHMPQTAAEGSPRVSTEAVSMQAELAALRNDLRTALATISTPNAVVPSSSSGGPATGGTSQVVHHVHTHTVAPGMYPALGSVPGQECLQHNLPVNRIEDLPSDGQTSPQPPSPPPASWRRRVVSSVTWGAIDAGLAFTAGAVHLTARAVSWAIPTSLDGPSPPSQADAGATGSGNQFSSPLDADTANEEKTSEQTPSQAQQDLTRSQWDMAIQLASSAVQALSVSVGQAGRAAATAAPASAATAPEGHDSLIRRTVSVPSSLNEEAETGASEPVPEPRPWPLSAAALGASSVRGWVVGRTQAQLLGRVEQAPLSGAALEEQIIGVAADLGRAVKRSPLPAQLGLLASRLLGLIQALDARYMLRDKTAKLALKNSAAALRLARSYQLHVFVARAAVASVEAAVAAIEAYRDERAPSAPTPPALSTLRAAALLLAQQAAGQTQAPPASPLPGGTPAGRARVA